jgi:NAD(P)-dependent dehydrogenase (short-subunit alcohol dehydrogenase family)
MSAEGPLVVIAGATGALGRATAEHFRDAGWTVIGLARPASLERIPDGVVPVACDISSAAGVARLGDVVAEHGTWRALAVCSGGFAMGDAVATGDEEIAAQLEINLLGPWRVARVAATAMREHGGGRIVVTLSRAAVAVSPGLAAYQVSKAAAARLVEVMAAELRGDGITVNGVLPSVMDTPSNRSSMGEKQADTWVSTAQVAAVIGWLCGEDAADISGALVPVYGRV